MSRAPDYESLYDFESQIETAIAAVLHEQTTIPAYGQRWLGDVIYPVYILQFTNGSASGHLGKAKDGLLYPDGFTGSLRARFISKRREDFTLTEHRRNVAAMRRYIYQFDTFITDSNLPYLSIEQILETGSTQGIDADQELDITDILFQVSFFVRTGAWPAIPRVGVDDPPAQETASLETDAGEEITTESGDVIEANL